ncbi:MAG: hypothetical protein FWD91_08390 [Treponema sp.]|nr:hypothetical protein [Treponema sp.]
MKKFSAPTRAAKVTIVSAFLSIFIVAVTLTVCDSVFTTGIGNAREYQNENIDVTIANLDRWISRAVGNPPLARQVTAAILNRLDNDNLSPGDRIQFQKAGIRMSVEASNMGAVILHNTLSFIADATDDIGENGELMRAILGRVQNEFRNNGGLAAAQDITRLVARDLGPMELFKSGETPRFPEGSFAHSASASDIAQAVLVLSLSKIERSALQDVNEWDDFDLSALNVGLSLCDEGRTVTTDGSAPAEALLLAAYLNLIAENERFEDNVLTSLIRGAFFSA